MFYLANIILSMGIQRLSQFLDEYLEFNIFSHTGFFYSYDLKLLWIGLLLCAVGLFFIILRWNKPHNHYMFWRIIAYILFVAGFGNLVDTDFETVNHYYVTYIAQIVFALSYIIPGILIWYYNRKQKIVKQSETQESTNKTIEDFNSESDIDRLRAKLKQASETNMAKNDPAFYNNLAYSSEILKEIQNSDFKIDQNFLEQIAKLTDFYLDLEDNKFQTNQSRKTLNEIIKTYSTINEALENIYDQNFSLHELDIESDIASMKAKLSMNGALDSPFEKFKKEQNES